MCEGFAVEHEWVDLPTCSDETARRTMAKLKIMVNGKLVTGVRDRRGDREHVVVPLHQMAEWLVANWYQLFHEAEDTAGSQRDGFEFRHNLAFAGDGFILPPLEIVPTDGAIAMRWNRSAPEYSEIEFTRYGDERIPIGEGKEQFQSLVEAVIARGREKNSPLEMLEEGWQAICDLDDEEREFARAAALLGADPFEISDETAQDIVDVWEGVPPSLRADLLRASNVEHLPRMVQWVSRGLTTLAERQRPAKSRSSWTDIRDSIVPPGSPIPWMKGYDLARQARQAASTHVAEELEVPYATVGSVSSRLQGLADTDSPVCIGTPRAATSTRFIKARAIAAFLSPMRAGPSLLSTLSTDFQAFTRAFAAEFLAPAEQIRALMEKGSLSQTALASEFRVSKYVIEHQINNHKLGYAPEM